MHNEIMETNTETNNRQKTQVAFFLFFFILQLLILRKSRNLLWNKSQTTHDITKFDLESQDHQLMAVQKGYLLGKPGLKMFSSVV